MTNPPARPRMGWLLCWLIFLHGGCALQPSYGPVSQATLQQLYSRIQSPESLGVRTSGNAIVFGAQVDAPDVVEVEIVGRGAIPSLNCSLNSGEPLAMVLDTGSQVTVIDADTAVDNNVAVLDPNVADVSVTGVVGNEKMLVGIVSPLGFPGCSISRYPCLVRTHHNAVSSFGSLFPEKVNLDLLGYDLPRRLCRFLTIDYAARRIVFGFRRSFSPSLPGAVSVPLISRNNLPYVRLRANGVEWEALLDTGSAFGVEVDNALATRLGLDSQAVLVQGGTINAAIGGTVDAREAGIRVAILPRLDGLARLHEEAEVAIAPGMSRVGSFYFKDYRVTFDMERQRLWFER